MAALLKLLEGTSATIAVYFFEEEEFIKGLPALPHESSNTQPD